MNEFVLKFCNLKIWNHSKPFWWLACHIFYPNINHFTSDFSRYHDIDNPSNITTFLPCCPRTWPMQRLALQRRTLWHRACPHKAESQHGIPKPKDGRDGFECCNPSQSVEIHTAFTCCEYISQATWNAHDNFFDCKSVAAYFMKKNKKMIFLRTNKGNYIYRCVAAKLNIKT